MNKPIVIVGDIHGCLEEFDELLKKLQYKADHMRLVLLEDLLDKGPNPIGYLRKDQEF